MRHEIYAAIVFRERHHFADALLAAGQHHDSIQAKRDAAMGRGAVAKGAKQMSEEHLLACFADAERRKNFRKFGLMNPILPPPSSTPFKTTSYASARM